METVEKIAVNECCGCEACENACPKQCITFQMDQEGFRYPIIDKERCINCGKCIEICKKRKWAGEDLKVTVEAFAAYAKDKEILNYSSSGGVFAIIANKILAENGIVYGAVLDKMKVKHLRIEHKNQLRELQKSKYLQSEIGFLFKEVKRDLKEGKKVLFSGTPCQISGLNAFLGNDYTNLITCDVVCHGVPSEKVFHKFKKYEEKKHGSQMVSMLWRDKRNGWHYNSIVENFKNGKIDIKQSYKHSFQRGFLDNLYLRPSCYECHFTGFPRVGDISLADYWQAEKHTPEFAQINKDQGMSLVILSSDKGKQLFQNIKDECIWKEITLGIVKDCSRHSYLPPLENKNRKAFFMDLPKHSYKYLMKKYIFADDVKIKYSLKFKIYLKEKIDFILQKR